MNDIAAAAKPAPRKRKRLWIWASGLLLTVAVLLYWMGFHGTKQDKVATFTAVRGPLNITVTEGGSIRAVDSQEIKCEVRVGYQGLKILKIVEEGYEVTAEDIRTNKVLVELDSSDLQKQITQQDIQYESAVASLTDAQQNYEIQINQNLSDIKAAEQKVRFARMDFDKYLGDSVTVAIVNDLGIEAELAEDEAKAAQSTARVAASSLAKPESPAMVLTAGTEPKVIGFVGPAEKERQPEGQAPQPSSSNPSEISTTAEDRLPASGGGGGSADKASASARLAAAIDFAKYANIDVLGDGEAKQKLRKLEDDLQVARKEQGQSLANLEGTKRLFEKKFVTRIDLEKDEIASENSRLKVQTASTARDLFLKYEFSKAAEEALSKYAETARELVRARKAAISKLAQAQAKLKSAQGQYNIQSRQRKELYEQLEKCSIKATKPGLVVYGRGGDDMVFYGGEERVREGASVRERQSIITIPDMSRMSVRVRIHESYINKVHKGQVATITVDAYPDKVMQGEVTSVGVLPDSQNMWMNPDMKVYLTTITLKGTNEWLKPGMTAKVEIMVNKLNDVVYVPIQAVSPAGDKQVCQVPQRSGVDRRVVETGESNDEFIEIKSGLKAGERVLLRPARAAGQPGGEEKPKDQAPPPSPGQGTPATQQTRAA